MSKVSLPNSMTLLQGCGLDLEYDTESRQSSQVPEPAMYETAYVTSHKGRFYSEGTDKIFHLHSY